MTTGRINQVTIVGTPREKRPAEFGRERPRAATHPEGQNGWLEEAPGRNPESPTEREPRPGQKARGREPRGHPFAPTEFPRGPSTAGALGPEAFARCDMGPQGGGFQRPITPEGGYGPRLAPEFLVRMMAIGQRSTAHIGAR